MTYRRPSRKDSRPSVVRPFPCYIPYTRRHGTVQLVGSGSRGSTSFATQRLRQLSPMHRSATIELVLDFKPTIQVNSFMASGPRRFQQCTTPRLPWILQVDDQSLQFEFVKMSFTVTHEIISVEKFCVLTPVNSNFNHNFSGLPTETKFSWNRALN